MLSAIQRNQGLNHVIASDYRSMIGSRKFIKRFYPQLGAEPELIWFERGNLFGFARASRA